MPVVDITARHHHHGALEPARKGIAMGDIRPVCYTCGWRGPQYCEADRPIAQVGLDAHIATTSNEPVRYEIAIVVAHMALARWRWS